MTRINNVIKTRSIIYTTYRRDYLCGEIYLHVRKPYQKNNKYSYGTQYTCDRLAHYLVCIISNGYTKSSGESKISHFDVSFRIDEEILGLEVTMKDSVCVAVSYTFQQLVAVTL